MENHYLQYCAKSDELDQFRDDWLEEIYQKLTILRLNDDCFYKIVDFLSPVDLCSFREICTRFRTIADYSFEKKYKSFHMTHLNLKDAKRVIRVFGGLITKLAIDQTAVIEDLLISDLITGFVTVSIERIHILGDPAKLLPLLDRYCLQLRDLELSLFDSHMGTNPEIISRFASADRLFSNLHRLVIKRWVNEASIACCLERCVALKELEIIEVTKMSGKWLAKHFESLESFTLKMTSICPLNIRKFFEMNQHLKNVKYDFVDYVERFGLESGEPMALVLGDIRLPVNLKRLEIDFGSHHDSDPMRNQWKNQILDYLANRTSLEHLLLSSVDLNSESVESLCRMKNLKTLKLTCKPSSTIILNAERCKKLANELPSLTEIHIIELPNITFDSIKEFIVNLKNLRKIFFHRYVSSEQTLTSKMILDLIEVRRKEEFGKGTLSIFLIPSDIAHINAQFERNERSKTYFEQQGIIKLLSTEL